MQEAVRKELHQAVMTRVNANHVEWIFSHLDQCVQTAGDIWWVRNIEEAMAKGHYNEARQEMKIEMSNLIKLVADNLSKHNRHLLNNILITTVYRHDRTMQIYH